MKGLAKSRTLAALMACALVSEPLEAHEFWIDVDLSGAQLDRPISAHMRVGQDLSGSSLPYLDTTVRGMTHVAPSQTYPIDARLGDRPAIDGVVLREPGLHVLAIETNPSYIVFENMPDFEDYLTYEGLLHIADEHRTRGLPEDEIAEAYIRNARSLIHVGPVEADQTDRPSGMAFEIVVDGTPFATGREALAVQLIWKGNAVPNAQIAMFHVPSGSTAPGGTIRTVLRTDDRGYAKFAFAGAGDYLLNAVRMDPVQGPGSVVWESHWASLTFKINSPE